MSLKHQVEIDSLFRDGRRIQGKFCVIVWRPAESFRFGVFVSRQIGSAVMRNRIKRLFREAIRLNQNKLTSTGWLGILPRAGSQPRSFEEIKTDVSGMFSLCRN